jgi:hypothetical protein
MARNKIQFRRGLSLTEFLNYYGTEGGVVTPFFDGGGPTASSAQPVDRVRSVN